jgi:tRNA-Thr(GGU) m(6)t(6)A37 methyltransferase TsaA
LKFDKFNTLVLTLGYILSVNITPIGQIITPFHQKFGIPRQGIGLSKARGKIEFDEHIKVELACEGIEQFSHLWLLFLFHENQHKGWSERVRPPRLGGNQKLGVFATRSSFRPNAIGMSVVKLLEIKDSALIVEGVDMLNNTPIIDIKPYIDYADHVADARSGFAQEAPQPTLQLKYSDIANKQLSQAVSLYPHLPELLENTLGHDPRPAYKKAKTDPKLYHLRLYDIDVAFSIHGTTALIHSLNLLKIK